MARRPSKRALEKLIAGLEPAIRKGFAASIADIASAVQLGAIEEALKAGNVEMAMRFIRMDRGFFAPLDTALVGSYIRGGQIAMSTFPRPPSRVAVRFNGRNPRAEAWLQNQSSRRIKLISDDTMKGVREVLVNRMAEGAAPRRTALDLVGRVSKTTGRREGGLIELTSKQMQYVKNMRADLSTKPPRSSYFGRERRDMRYDSLVNKAIANKSALSAADINQMTQRYHDRLFQLRGEMIARTETLQSFHAAQREGLNQIVDQGLARPDQITEIWDAAGDDDTRETHAEADGQPIKLGETFTVGEYSMLHPGDSSLGAPAEEIIACRCRVRVDIDYLS